MHNVFQYYFRIVSEHPIAILLLVSLCIFILGYPLPTLTTTNDFRVFFSKDNPQLLAFESIEATYGKQDNVYFLISSDQGDLFSREKLKVIYELSERAWQIPYAKRVSSLVDFQHTYSRTTTTDDNFIEDELVTEPLVGNPNTLTDTQIASIKNIALQEPMLRNNLVSADGRTTGINVRLNLPDNKIKANNEVIEQAREILQWFREEYPQLQFHITGSANANVTLGEAVENDLRLLISASYTIIILGLLVFFRSITATLITLLIISLSIIGTMGVYAWLGRVLTPVAGFVPSVVMTIAVADSVHLLVSYFYERRKGTEKQAAIHEALRINVQPIFITSLTTIIGVLMLNFSDSPPYRDLGNMVAIGVFLAYLLTLFLTPVLLLLLPNKSAVREYAFDHRINQFADWVIAHNRKLLYGIGTAVLVCTAFIPQNRLTERWHEYFDTSFEQRQTIERMNQDLTGVHAIRYELIADEEHGINEPQYMSALEQLSQWFRQQPGVAYVGSMSNVIKRLNKNMHGDDPQQYRIPESRELIAQYLLLYELSLPIGHSLKDTINAARSATEMVVVLHKTDSEKLLELEHAAQTWAKRHIPQVQLSDGTGLDMIFAHINHRNIRSLLSGTAIALVLISMLMIVVLRSVKLGLVSMLPNLAPAGLAYGCWSWIDGEIDLSASVVICMSLGIVVDDTVHFLTKYMRARRETAISADEGVRYAFNTVGVALTITTVVLVAGFSILAISPLSPTRTMGSLLAITLAFALVVDFLLLPPLVVKVDRNTRLITKS